MFIHWMDIRTGKIYAKSPTAEIVQGRFVPASYGGLPGIPVSEEELNPPLDKGCDDGEYDEYEDEDKEESA